MTDFETILEQRVRRYAMTNDHAFNADAIAQAASASKRRGWTLSSALSRPRVVGRPALASAWLLLVGLVVVALAGAFVVGNVHTPISAPPSPIASLPAVTVTSPRPSSTAFRPSPTVIPAPVTIPPATVPPATGTII